MDTVMSLGTERPVVSFSKSNCGICYTTKVLISGFGANPTVYELDEMPNGKQLERELEAAGRSVLTLFIGQELIGGNNEVLSLQVRGKLAKKLKIAGAIWV